MFHEIIAAIRIPMPVGSRSAFPGHVVVAKPPGLTIAARDNVVASSSRATPRGFPTGCVSVFGEESV